MTFRRRDVSVVLTAALVRVAYLLVARPPFAGPYWLWSDQLLAGGPFGFGGAHGTDFEPIYPLFLAAARIVSRDHVIGVQLLQVAVSSVGAIFLCRLVNVLTGRSGIAMFSAMLYAVDLLLVKQSVGQSPFVVVTTLLIAFAYAFVTATTTAPIVVAGLILGLLVLTRTATLPLLVGVVVILAAQRQARHALAATLAALVVIVPWSLRSYSVNGSWWPTRSGLNLFISSLPASERLVPDYDPDLLEPMAEPVIAAELQRANDDSPAAAREIDDILTKRALSNLSADPLRAVEARGRNLVHYFWPPLVPYYVQGPRTHIVIDASGEVAVVDGVSRSRAEVLVYSAYYALVLLAAIVGAIGRRHVLLRSDAILMWILATFALTHAVYFPATRYRAPIIFVLLFYAAVTFDRSYHVLRARLHLSSSVSAPTPA
jgi:hypothetical protein